ncbi:hypothetical protein F8O06_05285 [Pseudoclavibacter sp. CFCC 14310]|uniref:hypothetical protein n=1 Tax=Pseudoclavibacter sp. CFCC 14310 TaxID=2615180 RepID=UPI001301470F|nr:hypothetical protein [Pseudoclavibacter sp. CFCC 14310]KAB1646179.1 hypothetical protein F8O06_05285 [Pseudoclavibacter sp. CFCC 14310]
MPILLLVIFAVIVLAVVVVWKVRPLRYLALTALGLSFAWTCLQALAKALSGVPVWVWWTIAGVVVALIVALVVVAAVTPTPAPKPGQQKTADALEARESVADRLLHESFNPDGTLKPRNGPPPRLPNPESAGTPRPVPPPPDPNRW